MTGRRGWVGSGLLVAAGIGVWSVGNWVFFILVGRLLGPQDYGLVAAVLSGCLVLYVLCSSLQPTLAASNRGEPPDAIFVRALRVTIAATVGVMIAAAVIIVIVGATIASFPTAVMLGAVTVLAGIAVFPLTLGQLQGERRFAAYSLGFITVGIMRPLAFLALWVAGVRVLAPLLGTAASWVIGAVVVLVLARRALHTPPIERTSTQWHEFRKSILPNAAGVTAIAILTNADVITAKLVLADATPGCSPRRPRSPRACFSSRRCSPRWCCRGSRPAVRAGGRPRRLVAAGVGVTLAVGAAFVLVAIPLGREFMRVTYGHAFRERRRPAALLRRGHGVHGVRDRPAVSPDRAATISGIRGGCWALPACRSIALATVRPQRRTQSSPSTSCAPSAPSPHTRSSPATMANACSTACATARRSPARAPAAVRARARTRRAGGRWRRPSRRVRARARTPSTARLPGGDGKLGRITRRHRARR